VERYCITVPPCPDIIWGTTFHPKNIWGNGVPPKLHHCQGHRSPRLRPLAYSISEIPNALQTDRIGNELNFDYFSLDVHLILITYKLLLIYYYNYY